MRTNTVDAVLATIEPTTETHLTHREKRRKTARWTTSNNACQCESCQDEIKTGDRIVIVESMKNSRFRYIVYCDTCGYDYAGPDRTVYRQEPVPASHRPIFKTKDTGKDTKTSTQKYSIFHRYGTIGSSMESSRSFMESPKNRNIHSSRRVSR